VRKLAKVKLHYFGDVTRDGAGQLAFMEGIMERSQSRPGRQWI